MRSFNPLIELWTVLLLVATTILVISSTLVIGPENGESALRFFGRFHVLVLHFPIVLLLLAPTFDFLSRRARYKALATSAYILWVLACIGVVVTVLLGMALAATEGFKEESISFHLTAGISVAVLALFCFGLRATWRELRSVLVGRCYALFSFVLIFMVMVTAHAGGNLVHGKRYLTEFAPQVFQITSTTDPASLPTLSIDDGLSTTVNSSSLGRNKRSTLRSATTSNGISESISTDISQFDLDTELTLGPDLENASEPSAEITRSRQNNLVSINTSPSNSEWQVESKNTDKTTKFAKRSRFMMKKYCFSCHNKKQQSGGIRLDNLPYKDLTAVDKNTWALSKTVIEQAEMHASQTITENQGMRLSLKEQRKLLSWLPNLNSD